jgi:hypothetical protein
LGLLCFAAVLLCFFPAVFKKNLKITPADDGTTDGTTDIYAFSSNLFFSFEFSFQTSILLRTIIVTLLTSSLFMFTFFPFAISINTTDASVDADRRFVFVFVVIVDIIDVVAESKQLTNNIFYRFRRSNVIKVCGFFVW